MAVSLLQLNYFLSQRITVFACLTPNDDIPAGVCGCGGDQPTGRDAAATIGVHDTRTR